MKNRYSKILITTLSVLVFVLISLIMILSNKFGFILIPNNSIMQQKVNQYENQIPNLDKNIGNVYFGMSIDGLNIHRFTAFTINYNDKFYLVTAGHCIINDEYRLTGYPGYYRVNNKVIDNIKFKSNSGNDWIYPKLLYYENDLMGYSDFAIFYDDKIDNGFMVDNGKDKLLYVLGNKYSNINIIRNYGTQTIIGESGSPIIDHDGGVAGIITTDNNEFYTPINSVIEEINKI